MHDRAKVCPSCASPTQPRANFCGNCGTALFGHTCQSCGNTMQPDATYCAQCGTPRSAQPNSAEYQAFRDTVQEHLTKGWEIERDGGDSVVLADRGIGSPSLHVVLFVTTGGFGNGVYALYRHTVGADRKRLTIDDVTVEPGSDTQLSPARLVGSTLLFTLGFAALLVGSLPGYAIGIGALLAGLLAFPGVAERLDRRHHPFEFGTVKSTDERRFIDQSRSCVVCDTTIQRGIEREYRKETAIAGIPVFTQRTGTNAYCRDCAHGESHDHEQFRTKAVATAER